MVYHLHGPAGMQMESSKLRPLRPLQQGVQLAIQSVIASSVMVVAILVQGKWLTFFYNRPTWMSRSCVALMLLKVFKSIEGAPIASNAGTSSGGVAPSISEYS